ncbi:MAG: HTTM domain-containing protein [Robiginitalea sp.]|nr:HTTM domain-containing protein [Robiginitalea sp.]
MISKLLFSRIDNSPLIIFRIFFGILISLESFGAILTGWVKRTLVDPDFTFSFIGFEWLQPLPGYGMYFYFILMGILGVSVALGYRYRLSMIAFTLLWAGAYLMQKTAYNNHYYLLVLLSAIMCFMPANRAYSLDVRRNPTLRRDRMFALVKWIVVAQLVIVYTYAAIAKLYTDWLDFSIIAQLMESRADYFLIGGLLQEPWVHKAIGIFGILFDFSVVPLLLYRPTRKWAFAASVFFHLFNSLVFQIGIFPYLSLAFTVFFYEPETIRRIFFKKKPVPGPGTVSRPRNAPALLVGVGIYFLIQLVLPVRHHFIQGDVLWTEEGHRMSWRMMLRSRSGNLRFRVVDKQTGATEWIRLEEWLSDKQARKVQAYPDFIWQFAQRLKGHYREKGRDISVYVSGTARVNRRHLAPLIDPETDLASVPWDPFRHHEWILPSPYTKGQE